MRTRGSFYLAAVSSRTRGAPDRKVRAEGRKPEAEEIIDLDESDSENRISKKRSREDEKKKTKEDEKKKKKKGSKETVTLKVNGLGNDSKAAKVQVNVVKDSKPSNENVNSPDSRKKRLRKTSGCRLAGDPFDKSEAMRRWPHRYPSEERDQARRKAKISTHENRDEEDKVLIQAVAHYPMSNVDGDIYELGDCVHINSDNGPDYVGRIVEFFEGVDGNCWFTAQWFYRPGDTAIGQGESREHDKKRVFFSTMKDDNLLECIGLKVNVIHVPALTRFESKVKSIPRCDYYYDMGYDISFTTFYNLPDEKAGVETSSSDSASTVSSDDPSNLLLNTTSNVSLEKGSTIIEPELSLLDLYSGCGAMSTGLCLGTSLSGVKLVTRWAVDLNQPACDSLKYNHPETEVRNESTENFLLLLKEWEKLCKKYVDSGDYVASNATEHQLHDDSNNGDSQSDSEFGDDEYEVEELVGIRWGTDDSGKSGLQFKVHWKGYGEDEDTWETYDSVMGCEELLKDFVNLGRRRRILPLPGDVDVICGGPPCQGASGFNRFRNVDAPLDDPRNHQIVVFMDIVDYLRPRFILMENVVDILKFAGGLLGRYALSRLVKMHYQAKLGLMVAGCYGLPQFRMRAFLWGASPLEKLPPYPLPTHDVVVRGGFPVSWERNAVAYDEMNRPKLHKAVVLGDAISDLPPVKNSEKREEQPYNRSSRTEFQHFMRLSREALEGKNCVETKKRKQSIFDHKPLELNEDDLERTLKIPKRKGANFRDLEGVIIRPDNTVELDVENRVMLASGKPLVPDYAIRYVHGRSLRPFGRLWWDEIVPTVVTRAEPHNQVILHPEQDRVLTIRENARIQGFPDYYKLSGTVRERYVQVGNAVAVPVARVLGYELGLAIKKQCGNSPVTELPKEFPRCLMAACKQIPAVIEDD